MLKKSLMVAAMTMAVFVFCCAIRLGSSASNVYGQYEENGKNIRDIEEKIDERIEIRGRELLCVFLPLGVAFAAMGSGIGLGRAVGSAMESMGRQPEAAGRIQMGMIIGCAFIEALTIYALLTAILLWFTQGG